MGLFNSKPWLFWKRRVSLVSKMLIIASLAALLSWWVMDRVMANRIGALFNQQLLELLEQQSNEDRLMFHDFLTFHSWAVTVLTQQVGFTHYVEAREAQDWMHKRPPLAIRHEKRPPWLPGSSITRKMAYASFVLLLDADYQLREIYGQQAPIPEDEFFTNLLQSTSRTDGSHNIMRAGADQIPHLITASALRLEGEPRAYLVFIAPLDNELLFMFQQQYRSMGVVAFIDNETSRITASSRPDLVPKGTELSTLKSRFHISGKSYFDYGFATESSIRFATLIPLANLETLSRSVRHAEHYNRAVAHGGLTLVFLFITFGISRRIEQFMARMQAFSHHELGLSMRSLGKGDQLELMKEQFRVMADEIVEARQRDSQHNEEMEQTNEELAQTNNALSESLELVQRTQTQIVQSEKMAALGGLVAGIAHEINTPVGIGFTSATHLEDETKALRALYDKDAMRRSDLEQYLQTASESTTLIQANLKRATQLIRSFKMVAVDQTSSDKRVFDLKTYLEDIILSLRPRTRRSRVTVSIDAPPELFIDSYPGAISQIVSNLVINSLTHGFTPEEEGQINLKIMQESDRISLIYSDNGRGIAPEDLNHIFDPFFTTIRGRGGSGLGLHIVHNLVTQTLKGTITCSSTPGQGCTFHITIQEGPSHATG